MRKMKRRQKKQVALLTVIIMIATIIAIMMLTPAFNIKEIKVYGNSVLKDKEIIRASGIIKGVNIFGVSIGEAKENIKSMGYVESVKISRSLPSTIEIDILEEVGVGYIKAEKGYVIITAEGRCIDITDGFSGEKGKKTASLPDVPLIKGLKDVRYKLGNIIVSEDKERLEALFTCLHELSKHGYIFDVREIDMSDMADIRFYYRTMDLCVSIGNIEKIGYKMECFAPILEQLGENPTGFISLERLIYRKEIEKETKTEQNGKKEE